MVNDCRVSMTSICWVTDDLFCLLIYVHLIGTNFEATLKAETFDSERFSLIVPPEFSWHSGKETFQKSESFGSNLDQNIFLSVYFF